MKYSIKLLLADLCVAILLHISSTEGGSLEHEMEFVRLLNKAGEYAEGNSWAFFNLTVDQQEAVCKTFISKEGVASSRLKRAPTYASYNHILLYLTGSQLPERRVTNVPSGVCLTVDGNITFRFIESGTDGCVFPIYHYSYKIGLNSRNADKDFYGIEGKVCGLPHLM